MRTARATKTLRQPDTSTEKRAARISSAVIAAKKLNETSFSLDGVRRRSGSVVGMQ